MHNIGTDQSAPIEDLIVETLISLNNLIECDFHHSNYWVTNSYHVDDTSQIFGKVNNIKYAVAVKQFAIDLRLKSAFYINFSSYWHL